MHARGTETWLMHVLRQMDRSRFQMDFLTVQGETGIYDEEIKSLGGILHACPPPTKKGAFLRGLRKILQEEGPFDIIHAHPYTLSGLILLQAQRAKIPVRIVHSHTDRRKVSRDKGVHRRVYTMLMKALLHKTATYGLAASKDAALSLFGQNWQKDWRWNVMYCGIDLTPFHKALNKQEMRENLGISSESRVIGHVGSFHFEKNHEFILMLFRKLAQQDLKTHLLLVGDGPLREGLVDKIEIYGLSGRVTLTGTRQDIPNLLSVMDVFVFPSLFEGLGLSVIEAQAAGLPCLVSDAVPDEAQIIKSAVQFLPLENSQDIWLQAIKETLARPAPDKKKALQAVVHSEFNIQHNVKILADLYESLHGKKGKSYAA